MIGTILVIAIVGFGALWASALRAVDEPQRSKLVIGVKFTRLRG